MRTGLSSATAKPDAAIYAEIRSNRWWQALTMMTRLKQHGVQLRGRPALSAAARGGCWLLVLEVFERMLDNGEPCAPSSVSEVTNACGRGSWQHSLQLLQGMRNSHIEPTVESFNAVSSSCEKVTVKMVNSSWTGWKWSLQCLEEASAKSLRASIISYNTAMATVGQALHWYHSFSVLSVLCSLEQSPCIPDDFSINTLATACEKKFRWEAAVEALKFGARKGIEVDVIGINAVISACGTNGQWQVGSKILMDLYGAGIVASQVSFAATASACEKANLWIRPLQLLRVAKFAHLSGSVLHGVALDALEKQGLWQRALHLFALKFLHHGCDGSISKKLARLMDPMAVSAVVSACKDSWKRTLSLTAEANNFPGAMSTEAWNACIYSCVGHVPIQDLLDWMTASQFEPDMLSYVALNKPGQNLIADSQSTKFLFKIRSEAVDALRRSSSKKFKDLNCARYHLSMAVLHQRLQVCSHHRHQLRLRPRLWL